VFRSGAAPELDALAREWDDFPDGVDPYMGTRWIQHAIGSVRTSDDDPSGYEAFARDADVARRLWTVSEEHVGERFAA